MDAPTAAVIAAIVSSVVSGTVSVIAVIANIKISNRSLKQSAAKDIAKVSVELKIRQLNELYGPLLQLTEQDRRLAMKLREGKEDPGNWRLLDHFPEILTDPRDGPLARAILDVDAKIEDLVINKGGLVRGGTPPASFTMFLAHYRLLKLAMDGHQIHPTADDYYPRQFDEDVKTAYEGIKSEIDKVLIRHEELLSELSR